MEKKFMFNNELDKELDEELDENLTEEENQEIDSYSLDDRVWTSNVEDIDGGDNFADYCEYFFGLLDEEEYYDN